MQIPGLLLANCETFFNSLHLSYFPQPEKERVIPVLFASQCDLGDSYNSNTSTDIRLQKDLLCGSRERKGCAELFEVLNRSNTNIFDKGVGISGSKAEIIFYKSN